MLVLIAVFCVCFADLWRLGRSASRRRAQAFRPGTRANQHSHALLFVAFCLYFSVPDFPATATLILLFAEFLIRGSMRPRSVTNVLSSLRTCHGVFGYSTSGFEDMRVVLWRRALPLTVRHTPSPAPPFPLELLVRLCSRARGLGRQGLALAALFSTAFFSLARLSSLLPATRSVTDFTRIPLLGDVQCGGGRARLRIKWGKAAQLVEDGFWVPLTAVEGSLACPVTLLSDLVGSLCTLPQHTPLFSYSTGAGAGRYCTLTQAGARSCLTQLLAGEGYSAGFYTFHSLRRGGCSLAFMAGAHLADLQHLGGWKSRAIDAYYPLEVARGRAARLLASESARRLSHLPTNTTY